MSYFHRNLETVDQEVREGFLEGAPWMEGQAGFGRSVVGEMLMRSWGAEMRCVCYKGPTEAAREAGEEEVLTALCEVGPSTLSSRVPLLFGAGWILALSARSHR